MKITRVTQQVKNTERASIFVDGKYSFSLSLNELVVEKLKSGLEITEADLKRLKKLSDDGKLKARAMDWVFSRPRSRREFRDYMRRKQADPELTEAFIEDFTSRGYMDEAKFADWLIDVRRRRGKSERAIRSELSSKGIDKEVVEKALSNGNDETERLHELVLKKSRLPRYKADKQKFIQYLARQGFQYSDIKSELEDI